MNDIKGLVSRQNSIKKYLTSIIPVLSSDESELAKSLGEQLNRYERDSMLLQCFVGHYSVILDQHRNFVQHMLKTTAQFIDKPLFWDPSLIFENIPLFKDLVSFLDTKEQEIMRAIFEKKIDDAVSKRENLFKKNK